MRSKKTALRNLFVILYRMNTSDLSILQKPLGELEFSDDFKEMAYCNNFTTVQDMLHTPVGVLLKHEGFSQHCYQELRNFLIKRDAIHLLKTEPSQLP